MTSRNNDALYPHYVSGYTREKWIITKALGASNVTEQWMKIIPAWCFQVGIGARTDNYTSMVFQLLLLLLLNCIYKALFLTRAHSALNHDVFRYVIEQWITERVITSMMFSGTYYRQKQEMINRQSWCFRVHATDRTKNWSLDSHDVFGYMLLTEPRTDH